MRFHLSGIRHFDSTRFECVNCQSSQCAVCCERCSPGAIRTPKGLLGTGWPAKNTLTECRPTAGDTYSQRHRSGEIWRTLTGTVFLWPAGSTTITSGTPRPASALNKDEEHEGKREIRATDGCCHWLAVGIWRRRVASFRFFGSPGVGSSLASEWSLEAARDTARAVS